MDILSHGLTGAILTGIVVKNPSRKQMLIGAGLALIPDIDTVAALWGREYYLEYHRVVMHTIFFVVLASPLLAWGLSKRGWFTFGSGLVVSSLAMVSHLFLDLMTSWGTAVLYPVQETRHAGNVVFMFDVWYPIWCGSLLFLSHRKKCQRFGFTVAFFLSMGYFLMAYISKEFSTTQFEAAIQKAEKGAVKDLFLVAQPWSPFTWAGFATAESKVYYSVKGHFSNQFETLKTVAILPESQELWDLQNHSEVIKFKRFARLPWVEMVNENGIKSYRWIDLSKEVSGIERSNKNFGVRIDINSQGEIVYQGFTYPSK
ncbi:MAG: metal-dependent hydrolase [Bdellovibrionales bacterium]|nr:metal-dependent hydrolase [Bdellovibrionales bacterium]